MTRTVVTGGGGFIGATVARKLVEVGHLVETVGHGSDADALTPARIAALGTFDVVVHCAGGSSVAASVQDPRADYEKTVPPFAALLDHVRARVPRARVVLLSSAAVYGNATQIPTPETCPLAPVSPYGRHKVECEALCRDREISCAIVRLFSVYGAGLRKQLLWDACKKARSGDVSFAGTGDEERDWLHVEDAAALIVKVAAHASPETPVFNGASGIGVRVRDVVGAICRELGAEAPRFTGTKRTGDPDRYIADISRARAIGWSPQIDIARGIAQYVAWFKTQP